jgi:hypothetical protein
MLFCEPLAHVSTLAQFFAQADLSVVAAHFRDAQSGKVHLAAIKKEFQLEIKPLPILSSTVRLQLFPLYFLIGGSLFYLDILFVLFSV